MGQVPDPRHRTPGLGPQLRHRPTVLRAGGRWTSPTNTRKGAYPLGRWLSDQKRAYRAGTMSSTRADELEELGMVWDTADAQFTENLAAARAYIQRPSAGFLTRELVPLLQHARPGAGRGQGSGPRARCSPGRVASDGPAVIGRSFDVRLRDDGAENEARIRCREDRHAPGQRR
ncbi:helicase associated domain-containing protein [Streptomyces sp. NPDC002206]